MRGKRPQLRRGLDVRRYPGRDQGGFLGRLSPHPARVPRADLPTDQALSEPLPKALRRRLALLYPQKSWLFLCVRDALHEMCDCRSHKGEVNGLHATVEFRPGPITPSCAKAYTQIHEFFAYGKVMDSLRFSSRDDAWRMHA